jgi:hypothetical protein
MRVFVRRTLIGSMTGLGQSRRVGHPHGTSGQPQPPDLLGRRGGSSVSGPNPPWRPLSDAEPNW